MKSMGKAQFCYPFRAAGLVDMGRRRSSNQDGTVLCPESGFFAVTDGMGGLAGGALAAEFIKKSMPDMMALGAKEFARHGDILKAADTFRDTVRLMSDNLFGAVNSEKRIAYGATFCGVWLLGGKAVFVSLGDSRGYLLPRYKKLPQQITEDHNIAALLVQNGELTRAEAINHPSSSRLTAFVGMKPPAAPDLFVRDVFPGDRILLCSDGLYGMVKDLDMARITRSSRSPERVCQRLIGAANANGGRDNISAAYIRILS